MWTSLLAKHLTRVALQVPVGELELEAGIVRRRATLLTESLASASTGTAEKPPSSHRVDRRPLSRRHSIALVEASDFVAHLRSLKQIALKDLQRRV